MDFGNLKEKTHLGPENGRPRSLRPMASWTQLKIQKDGMTWKGGLLGSKLELEEDKFLPKHHHWTAKIPKMTFFQAKIPRTSGETPSQQTQTGSEFGSTVKTKKEKKWGSGSFSEQMLLIVHEIGGAWE